MNWIQLNKSWHYQRVKRIQNIEGHKRSQQLIKTLLQRGNGGGSYVCQYKIATKVH